MKTHLIIGAGQLGSRHLQGLLRLSIPQRLFVVDASDASLEIAAARASEIHHACEITYLTSLAGVPDNIDLAIVATGASVREQVTAALLNHASVNWLILEKVLFQDAEAYQRIKAILDGTKTRVWVNHPRRMFPHYQQIREQLSECSGPKLFQVTGNDWGMGCNALHLLDVMSYLTGERLTKIETDWIDPVIHPSKREGYIEFTGTLKASFENGSRATIASLQGNPGPLTVSIASTSDKWLVQEGGTPAVTHLAKSNSFAQVSGSFALLFQSTLTTTLAEQLYETGTCDLPDYAEAMDTHLVFLEAMKDCYKEITGQHLSILPIT